MAPTDLARLRTMADAVHSAALNLAMTYGVFHGINASRAKPVVNTQVAQAINSIQHDLLHLMTIRLCALCDHGPRADDASIVALERKITPAVRAQLITENKKWRAAVGFRAQLVTDVARSIANLRRQRTGLRAQDASLKAVKHFRDKLLAHVTVGHAATNRVVLGELWKLTRTALAAATSVRLIFSRSNADYLREARLAEGYGKSLAKAILAKRALTQSRQTSRKRR